MTGQCRQMWLTAPSIYRNVVEPNNADIFLCLNRDSMVPAATTHQEEIEIVKAAFASNIKGLVFTDDAYSKEVNELIDSNYAKIDAQYQQLGRTEWDKQLNIHNTDQYFKLKKCSEMAVEYATKNGFKYDIMVRCRPDIGWFNKFDLSRPVAPDMLYVNRSMHNVSATPEAKFVDWVEDTCFFGDQDTMQKFCAVFSDNMVDNLDICAAEYDLTCATEKLLARVLIDSGIDHMGINDYFDYNGPGWIRPKLVKHYVDFAKSPNFHLVEQYCQPSDLASEKHAVYFDRIGQHNIVMDETIVVG